MSIKAINCDFTCLILFYSGDQDDKEEEENGPIRESNASTAVVSAGVHTRLDTICTSPPQLSSPLGHRFSTYQVSIMQSCDLCGSYIWGMEKAYMCSGELDQLPEHL